MENKTPARRLAFLLYLVGRAGLEPATNGLKVQEKAAITRWLTRHSIRLDEVYFCSGRPMPECWPSNRVTDTARSLRRVGNGL